MDQLQKDRFRDECRKKLNKAWREEEVEKEINLDLKIQWQLMKGYEKHKKMTYWDMSKWRIARNGLVKNAINCWSRRNKAYQAYFS